MLQRTIVRQKQQSFAVAIQAANRINASNVNVVPQAANIAAELRQHIVRLVEQQVLKTQCWPVTKLSTLGMLMPRSMELICDMLRRVAAARSLRDQSFSVRSILMRCPSLSRNLACAVRPSPNCSIALLSVWRNWASENGFER